ncbi:hypothetical protein ACF3N0_08780 [Moraxella atlantae]|uniref:hypothetical protein n=1 Tax=Faucicola atlantae TaxID=34059 RepID=UPI003753764B
MVQAKVKNDFDTRQVVLDAVNELHSLEYVATRATITELTGLKQSLVDDCLKHLCDEMLIRRVERGCYAPVQRFPAPRAMWQTVLPDGTVKLEIGDEHILTLTPREARMIGMMMAGFMMQAHNIAIESHTGALANSVQQDVAMLRRELNSAMKAKREECDK